jgi:regulator of sirC expression with transglutaminase-like and TPR domain
VIIDTLRARQAFADVVSLDEGTFPLDRAALTLGLEDYPELDMSNYLRRLDTFAARAEVLLGKDRSPLNVIESINEVLFIREGLHGNSDDYYDPKNSYLNEVLDRKTGIPITLSIIYIEVARRIGFPIEGVGFPGHFIAKHVVEDREILIDPFNQGKILTIRDCQELLDPMYGGSVPVTPSLLQAMEKKAIITRMLYNLKGIYYQKEAFDKALSIVDRILMINPQVPSEIRDRGLLYMQTSFFAKALADLNYYLAHTSASEDKSYIEGHIKTLEGIVCAAN